MRCAPPILPLLLVLASAALAGDGETIGEEHPLEAALAQRLRAQQIAAVQRVVDAQRALLHAAEAAYVDRDHDGKGEIPTLPEVLGLAPWRGSDDPAAGIIGWSDARLRDGDVVEASGYLYRVVLPREDGLFARTRDQIDPELAEEHAVILAWPVHYGISGRWSFAVTAHGPTPLAVDEPDFSGLYSPAPPNALAVPERADADPGGFFEPLKHAGKAHGDRYWSEARSVLDRLRTDSAAPDGWTGGELRRGVVGTGEGRFALKEIWADVLDAAGAASRADGPVLERPIVQDVTWQAIAAAIAEDLRFPMERAGQWERQKASIETVGAVTPAKFVESRRAVLVCPKTFEIVCRVADVPKALVAEVARLLVAHELAHALDFQTYPLTNALHDCDDEASIAAWSAVVEGHAQQVTRRVAASTGQEEAFGWMLRLVGSEDVEESDVSPDVQAAMAGLSFPYEDGERFMDAVLARHGADGVARVLREPPRRPMQIETPELWFARGEDAVPDDWTDAIRELAVIEPKDATVARTPMLRRTLRASFAGDPRIDADVVADGIDDVEVRVATAPDVRTLVVSSILLCRDADAARAYVIASRALQDAQDRDFEANPLIEPEVEYTAPPSLPGIGAGYRVTKRLRTAAETVHGQVISVAAGRFVVELATTRREPLTEGDAARLVDSVRAALAALLGR